MGPICTAPECWTVIFENRTATCFAYATVILGQAAGLPKEEGADLLKLICESEGVEKSVVGCLHCFQVVRHIHRFQKQIFRFFFFFFFFFLTKKQVKFL